ncbi:hypothetical protein Syun_001280 [Stephania yunnanensis]|uniref:Uncharacterized protein n=1 Tax=Stephania yunnanensis TaxID=152371 RepID=A0AAP0LGC7_9MAGN
MVNSAKKVRLAGNPNVMVYEQGTIFGYTTATRSLLRWVSTKMCEEKSSMESKSFILETWIGLPLESR